ncbi:MAG: hypothetical protein K2L64_02430, partial [Ureaplasma sp.]|nr:hypothetical protein [Ureaplasma sp.]
LVYFENKFEIIDLSNNSLVHKLEISHNLNQLIKVYYSDLDKTTFTNLNNFTICMEIKLKKFAKLVITDFINCIGE